MSNKVANALKGRERSRARYLANTSAVLAHNRELYHARVARQRAALREFEALKAAVAALAGA